MSQQRKRIFWPLLTVLVTAVATLAFVIERPRNLSDRSRWKPMAREKRRGAPAPAAKTNGPTVRNLSLQPEAFNLSRRLGKRFSPGNRDISTLIGTLAIGSDRKIVTAIRKQTDDGEEVEIHVAGSLGVLTWNASQGALSSNARATGNDRDLIERLVFDSPDQFVLAQLRGASYYTIAYNVRPVDAGENYHGPLWNIVRVNDPENDETKRPQSFWRLYYLNAATGLIDRIESEVQGQRIVAEVSGWTDQNGEQVPTQIAWKQQGKTLMQYSVTNFSSVEK